MTVASVSQGNVGGLPQALRTAQAAIHFPEVQEMLRKLSAYNLGIFMPHRHDDETGNFLLLPASEMQVESGLEVSLQPMEKFADQSNRFVPVGWLWRAGATAAVSVCEMVQDAGSDDIEPSIKHKMLKS